MAMKLDTLHFPQFLLARVPVLQRQAIAQSKALLNCDLRLSVIWSAKSACTAVYTWFAHVSGFGDELSGEGRGPHEHRGNVYHRSGLYLRSLKADAAAFRTLRVIRDPYTRAVSSYRHALMNAYSDPYMAAASHGTLNRRQGYSFHQFLDMLESVDIRRANLHFRAQFRPMERIREPDAVINISKSDLFGELRKIERMWSLPPAEIATLDWFVEREASRKAKQLSVEGADLDRTAFDASAAQGQSPFPDYSQLLTPPARQRIERIYAIDFAAYRQFL